MVIFWIHFQNSTHDNAAVPALGCHYKKVWNLDHVGPKQLDNRLETYVFWRIWCFVYSTVKLNNVLHVSLYYREIFCI